MSKEGTVLVSSCGCGRVSIPLWLFWGSYNEDSVASGHVP